MIKAIIFDMNGVIADLDKSRFKVLQYLLSKRGITLPHSAFSQMVGKRTKVFLHEVVGDMLDEQEIHSIYRERKKILYESPARYIASQPFIEEAASKLVQSGYLLGVASSAITNDIKFILNHLKLSKYFPAVSGSDNLRLKPHPDVYLDCLNQLGIAGEESASIEDSPIGIEAAKSAGLYSIAVTHTYQKQILSKADLVIDSLVQLTPQLITKLYNTAPINIKPLRNNGG